MLVPEINPDTFTTLQGYHNQYWKEYKIAFPTGMTGAFLLLAGVIVIGSASLCFIIPGINVVTAIVLPGWLPGLCGIAIGSVLIFIGFRYRQKMKGIQDNWIALLKTEVDSLDQSLNKKIFKKYILNLLTTEKKTDNFFKKHLLETLKKEYPEKKADRSREENKIFKSIDLALAKVMNPNKKHKKK